MLFIFLIIIFTALYTFLFTLIPLDYLFLILWIPLSIILSIITIILLLLLYLCIASHTKPTNKFKHFILRNACFIAIKCLNIKIIKEGFENVPKETFVVYANHKSNMDPLLIYYSLNSVCSAIGKKSLFQNPIMNMIAKTFAAVPIDRENDREAAKSIVTGIKLVKNGLSMIIFPEGGIKTRDTEEMVNLRAGAYKLAVKANAPVLPISICGSSMISKTRFFKRKTIKIICHRPISKDEYANMNTHEVGTRVEELINSDIREFENEKK